MAFQWNPRLYCQIMEEHVSFDHIAKAWWIGNDPDDPVGKDEKRVSQFLEYLARRKFSEQHGSIEKDYWNKKPTAGCALTGDGYVHSVMNITDPELVLYEDRVHQLCRDVHRTFGAAAHPNKKAEKDLKDAAEMLYTVLTRVISPPPSSRRRTQANMKGTKRSLQSGYSGRAPPLQWKR